ncbi:YciI family protein [Cellulomonas rhizosphaerae]|uniref:YCII-related domain-containing protein n=1 Tax=Cellulomonas rhizosphaerae TaxID=2293719 RepID=A0A413RNN7_9CELL|nr:YciI family protein [Cellulomonas rhizosphaerae]RHA43577.1 hypothetical protein D1825_05650 [Cellulomonas rhizosphaerae]
MTTYLVLLHEDEGAWAAASSAEREAAYAAHAEFNAACGARGHTIVHAHELAPAATALLVRGGSVTDGPYTEAVEQLSGYYLVETSDVADLAALVSGVLGSGCAELRPVAA